MSWTIIYLGPPSPAASSDPPESEPGKLTALVSVLLRMGFTWLSVLSLLHWPGSHLHRTLSGILPCEARTFLVCALSGPAAAIARPAYILMHFTRESDSCQLRRGNILRLQIPSEVNSWGPPPCLRRQSTQGTLKVSSPRNKPARSVLR